jgi:hypothetical protein
MAGVEAPALRDSIANAPAPQFFWGHTTSVRFTDLVGRAGLNCGTSLGAGRTELVLKAESEARQVELKDDILKLCPTALPRHKVPAAISFVPALNFASTGKLPRR